MGNQASYLGGQICLQVRAGAAVHIDIQDMEQFIENNKIVELPY